METTTQERVRSRRWKGRFIRLGLVALALGIVMAWIGNRVSAKTRDIRIERTPVTDATLGAGDLRIFNRDSSVNLILRGDKVLAGLSPQTVAKVQAELQKSAGKDSQGLGGLIASTVKSAVAGSIGTQIVYPVSDIRDMRYEDGQLIIEREGGGETRLFGDAKVNRQEVSKTFSEEDAERFIQAVRARKDALPRR